MNLPPPARVIDNVDDAQVYYNNTPNINDLSDAQKVDLTARASDLITSETKVTVSNTGVPASIPGLLNVVLSDVDPNSRYYQPAAYSYGYVNVGFNYNKSLPVSSLNRLGNVNVIGNGNVIYGNVIVLKEDV
jgi:hypothetical protein